MEERAQVAIEYLLMALFGITLAIIAAIVIDSIRNVATQAQGQILEYRDNSIASLLETS